MVVGCFDRSEFPQGAKRALEAVLVYADNYVPVLHHALANSDRPASAGSLGGYSNAMTDGPSNNVGLEKAEGSAVPKMRVFVGVQVAPEIARILAGLASGLKQFSARLVPAADIHLTLVPPWNEVCISEPLGKLHQVTDNFSAFTLTFRRLCYGPQPRRPRLLWAECAATDEIASFHAALSQAFGRSDERPFRPHATVARLRGNGLAIARRHPIDQELALTQQVDSIALFQSPPPGESGYRVLASLQLAGGAACATQNPKFSGPSLADHS